MNNDSLPVQPQRVTSLPPPPALPRISLPPDYQRAYELMGLAHEAAIPVARLAGPEPKPKGVSIASPVMVAVPMPVARSAPSAKTEPIVRAVPLVTPVQVAIPVVISRPAPNAKTEPIARPVAIAEPVAVAVAEAEAIATPTPASVAKSTPPIRARIQMPKVADETSTTLADPSSRLW